MAKIDTTESRPLWLAIAARCGGQAKAASAYVDRDEKGTCGDKDTDRLMAEYDHAVTIAFREWLQTRKES